MTLEIGFRVDAGPVMGYGHVVRCSALARELERRGDVQCTFWSRTVAGSWPRTEVIPGLASREEEASWIAGRAGHLPALVFDRPDPQPEELGRFRRITSLLVCIDDANEILFDCDLLVNPSLNRRIRQETAPETRVLRGAPYVLLSEAFRDVARPWIAPSPLRVLACFGGSDPEDLSARLVGWFGKRLPPGIASVDLVLGPGYGGAEAVSRVLDGNPRWHIHRQPPDLAGLMTAADVGLFTASTLLYEALACGLPSLFISINPAQRWEAELVHELGAGVHLGAPGTLTRTGVKGALQSMCSVEQRQRLSRRALSLVDGGGCGRVAGEILDLLTQGHLPSKKHPLQRSTTS